MIRGAPYSPHSQGIVERIHVTIRTALLCKFLELQKDFNIETQLPIIVNAYNNTVHSVTKHTPFEIFYTHNNDLMLEVYHNTVNYFSKRNKDSITYDINERCLLINNIIKSKKIKSKGYFEISINKIKKDKIFIKMCAIIKKVVGGGKYLLEIANNYKEYNLKKNDLCLVDFKMIRKCEKKLWENINNYKNKNLTSINNDSDSLIESLSDSDISNKDSIDSFKKFDELDDEFVKKI